MDLFTGLHVVQIWVQWTVLFGYRKNGVYGYPIATKEDTQNKIGEAFNASGEEIIWNATRESLMKRTRKCL